MPGENKEKKEDEKILVPEISSDELLAGDEGAIREKIAAVIEKRVNGNLTPERTAKIEEAKKSFAIFSDEDEDIKEYANDLMDKEFRNLSADASDEDIKNIAEKISKKVSRIKVAKHPSVEGGVPSPVPSGGGSAAASHTQDDIPRTVEQAEAMASRIASEFVMK